MDEVVLEVASLIVGRWKAHFSGSQKHIEIPKTYDGDGNVERVRIGQEGRWLVLRPVNPLAEITMRYCQFFQIDYPETGHDEDGPYVRWPLNDVTLLK